MWKDEILVNIEQLPILVQGGKQDVMLCFHKQNVQNFYCLVIKKIDKTKY